MLFKSKGFQITLWLLLVVVIIWISNQISFIFHPLVVLIKTVFFPMLVAGIFYYLTVSVVDWLTRRKIPRSIAILMIFLIFVLIILFAAVYLSPILERQLTSLIANTPRFLAELNIRLQEFQESSIFAEFERFEFFQTLSQIDYVKVVDSIVASIYQNIGSFLGSIANFVVVAFTIPILWFYMLKDGSKLTPKIVGLFPEQYQREAVNVLRDMNDTIRSYIQGMLLVSLFVGILAYIGYSIIGLDYALLLAAIVMVTEVIPYFGPVLGTIPGVIVALIASPVKAILVVVMIVVIQQLESQLVSPVVIGKKLKIHPVTIIVILLTAASLGGLLAVVLAVPSFAIAKVIATHTFSFGRRLMQERSRKKY